VRRTSLVAVCCSRAVVSSRLLACSSLKQPHVLDRDQIRPLKQVAFTFATSRTGRGMAVEVPRRNNGELRTPPVSARPPGCLRSPGIDVAPKQCVSPVTVYALVTTPSEILANPDRFDGQVITLEATMTKLRQHVSRRGNPYYTFELSDGKQAIRVFSFGRSWEQVDLTQGLQSASAADVMRDAPASPSGALRFQSLSTKTSP
jgi:hypothetical protein